MNEYEEMIEALKNASTIAEANMMRLYDQKEYTESLIFEAIRDRTRKMAEIVSEYRHLKKQAGGN